MNPRQWSIRRSEDHGMPDLFQKSGALFSECGKYRYRLWRIWDDDRPIMCWVAQNPSVANDVDNDPTVRKMMGFAKRDGCGGIMLANVMAAIATQERELMNMVDSWSSPGAIGSVRKRNRSSARRTATPRTSASGKVHSA
jgi:hypothetical protein